MKKAMIIVLALAVLAVALTGASKWPAIVRIYNGDGDSTAYFNFEGDEYPIVQLTVAPGETKVYDFPRGIWDGKLTFCGVTKSFEIDARHNLWLNLPSCDNMRHNPAKPLFLGEPTMEKINMNVGSRLWSGGTKYNPTEVPQEWRFQY